MATRAELTRAESQSSGCSPVLIGVVAVLLTLMVGGVALLGVRGGGPGGGFSLMTTRRTVIRSGPPVEAMRMGITVGETTRAELDELFGEPEARVDASPLEVRRYVHRESVVTERRLLDFVQTGKGTSSSSQEVFIVLRDDVVVRTSENPSDDAEVEAAYSEFLHSRVNELFPGTVPATGTVPPTEDVTPTGGPPEEDRR